MSEIKARLLGLVAFGILGLLIGSGTGIVGGVFGAVAGLFVFGAFGAIYGLSVGPTLVNFIAKILGQKE